MNRCPGSDVLTALAVGDWGETVQCAGCGLTVGTYPDGGTVRIREHARPEQPSLCANCAHTPHVGPCQRRLTDESGERGEMCWCDYPARLTGVRAVQ